MTSLAQEQISSKPLRTPPPLSIAPADLTDRHFRELTVGSAIPADLLAEEGVRSLAGAYEVPEPDPDLKHPDLSKGKRFGQHPDVVGAGILFPVRDAEGRMSYQFKPDHPRIRDGKPVKYESAAGTRLLIHVPIRVRGALRDPSIMLRITEGVKKVLAAVGAGYPTIGLLGVNGWKVRLDDEHSEPLPDLDEIEWVGRIVLIEFDSDVSTKPSVRAALEALRSELRRRGAMPVTVIFPDGPNGEKWGVDDFLASGGDLRALENAALFMALTSTAPTAPYGGERRAAQHAALVAQLTATSAAASGSDGEQLCHCSAAAELRLITDGPVPAQEALAYRYLIRKCEAARARGHVRIRTFRPADVAASGISSATFTRAYNKLRTADQTTLPIVVSDSTSDEGHSLIDIRMAPTIGDAPWSERGAYEQLTTGAVFAEERKKQGGSKAAVAARWQCPVHPNGALRETTTKHYRCAEGGCGRSSGTTTTSRRISGQKAGIQVEDRPGSEAPEAGIQVEDQPPDHQVDDLNEGDQGEMLFTPEAGLQVEYPPPPLPFVSHADQGLAADRHAVALSDDAPDIDDTPQDRDVDAPPQPQQQPPEPADSEPVALATYRDARPTDPDTARRLPKLQPRDVWICPASGCRSMERVVYADGSWRCASRGHRSIDFDAPPADLTGGAS